MGDASLNNEQLSREQYRKNTFTNITFNIDEEAFAKAGFYYTHKGNVVKCFQCNLEIDTKQMTPGKDITILHKEKKPDCIFAQSFNRSKKFASYDSLRFEKERLETFIEWPVPWLPPRDLAADGFYYLRTADHCACVFCRGIVGAWEMGDTPRGEHQRHFPHCPFIRGQPVGNIPLVHSGILSKLSPSTGATHLSTKHGVGVDVCGTPRHMAGSYPENRPPKNGSMVFEGMGLPQHSGAKRKDYLTYDSRLASFVRWPELVKQKPEELADAGFFYCGLSDHVRCFHCGSGLRNWESDDKPWDEHARWYPECNFVLFKKGQEFIDKVRRENPPYIRSQPSGKATTSTSASAAAPVKQTISESELDPLMELDIIRAVLNMGFPQDKVRAALHRKLEQTGLPFFSLEPCIEAVLQYMEEETRQTLQKASNRGIENEATAQQVAKIQAVQPRSQQQSSSSLVASATSNSPVVSSSNHASSSTSSASAFGPSASVLASTVPAPSSAASSSPSSAIMSTTSGSTSASSVSITTSTPAADETPVSVSSAAAPTITPSSVSSAAASTSTSAPVSSAAASTSTSAPVSAAAASTSTSAPVSSAAASTSTSASVSSAAASTSTSFPSLSAANSDNSSVSQTISTAGESESMEVDEPAAAETLTQPMDIITEADEIMGIAEVALKPPTSGPPSLDTIEKKVEGHASSEKVLGEASTSRNVKKVPASATPQSSQELAEELERIRDIRMCKVCMDAEMDVVFLPCQHMVTCSSCALALAQCPICREDIKYSIKPILS
ncbi:death-associated inhibitor of apoptosis 2-like isoform X2 [Homarus americanus]|uniref:death-associated inhibitor of apoptosis 2-like isoform X2 n=1 Tax=Homarus americanus TaxID=6706 RepID=UPI001C45AEBE|nr:death-associated inhibitor of apoptosis 2-like isoform X2 [Homarus americanus]